MATTTKRRRTAGHGRKKTGKAGPLPGQVVLVLQGGGALGAYQVGVYEALHEAGIEPDWVIGTSIGAINAALIAGNEPPNRLARLHHFWRRIEQTSPFAAASIFLRGIEAFFVPRALAFGGVHARVGLDGEPYWDGGVYSNTPIEAVLDDKPRRDAVIFGVNVWQPSAPEPESIWQVMGRQKDIQYASRADSHIARQKQIHHLRHVIRELAKHLPATKRESAACKELASWGCGTTMHVVRLLAPTLDSEDYLKDIDFTPAGIRARWQAGLTDTRRMIERAPWDTEVEPMEGVIVHELSARTGMQIKEAV